MVILNVITFSALFWVNALAHDNYL